MSQGLPRKVPYGRQSVGPEDLQSVVKTLKSDWLTQGPAAGDFEKALADYCGAPYAVVVSSGTAALHLACLAAGLKPGEEAITSPLTFVATSNAVLYAGARPVFADIDASTGNLSPQAVSRRITRRTKALLPVHYAGLPADMKELHTLAKRHGLTMIEDASHALGAEYRSRRVGACQYSDMSIFSFHPVKLITTGEGGCVTTRDKKIYARLKALSSHGIYKDSAMTDKNGGWYYEMQELGFNYRITDFQCALGLSQLKKMGSFLKRRREIARRYEKGLRPFKDILTLPDLSYDDRTHAWHLYVVRLNGKSKFSGARRKLYDFLRTKGIFAQVHYIPVYQQPYYRRIMPGVSCPNAEKFYHEALSLPIYPGLKNEAVDYVIRAISDFLKGGRNLT